MPNRQNPAGSDQLDDGPLQLEQEQQEQQLQQQGHEQVQQEGQQQQQQQQAGQKKPEQGKGYQSVLKLLQGKGKPEPKDVAKVLWQYPEEKGAIVTLLQQTPALGNSYVQQVVEATKGWHLDAKAQVLSWGDAEAEGEDYFYASGKRKGAAWKLGDFAGSADKKGLQWQKGENWTGQVGKDGLHTEIKTGDDQKVVVDGNYKDKQATLNADYLSGDNTLGIGLHGKDADHLGGDLHGSHKTKDGASLKGKVGLDKQGDDLATSAALSYDGNQTDLGVSGKLVDSKEHEAKLTGSHQLDDKTKLTGELGQQTKAGETTYGAKAGYAGANNTAAVEGTYTSKDQHSAKVGGSHKLGDKSKVSGELSQQTKDAETTYGAKPGFKGDKASVDVAGKYLDGDNYSASTKGKFKVAKDLGLSVDAAHKVASGKSTDELGLGLQSDENQLDFKAAFTDKENFSLSLKDTYKFGEQGSLMGEAAYGSKDGEDFASLGLAGKLNTDDHLLEANADLLKQGDKLDLSADFDGTFTLMDDKLYGHAFGKLDNILEDPKFQVGGGLTWTPKDKMAVTLAGLVDQDGGFDTRLQFDIFKKKVDNAKGLSDQKKKALFSVFVGYKQENDGGLMNDHFGAGKFDAQQGMGYAGIKIPF